MHTKNITLIFVLTLTIVVSGCSMKNEEQSKQGNLDDQKAIIQGLVHLRNGDSTTAVNLFEKAIDINNENENAYLLAAQVYMKANRYEDAVRILSPAMDLLPNSGQIPYLLAISLKELGKTKMAYLAASRSAEVFEAWQKKEQLKRSQMLILGLAKIIQEEEKAN